MDILIILGIVFVFGIVVWILVQWLKSMQGTVAGSTAEVSRRLEDLNQKIGEISEVGRGIKSLRSFSSRPNSGATSANRFCGI